MRRGVLALESAHGVGRAGLRPRVVCVVRQAHSPTFAVDRIGEATRERLSGTMDAFSREMRRAHQVAEAKQPQHKYTRVNLTHEVSLVSELYISSSISLIAGFVV